MNPVDRALWYIESHSDAALVLDDIAAAACVSKHHLLRAFGAATGLSIMRYVRGRRMSAAARRLAEGANDILSLAVETGYGSHEAFTRAFRDQFGVTPEAVRAQQHVRNLQLLEPIGPELGSLVELTPPRFEDGAVRLVAGIEDHYAGFESSAGVPSQWQRFARHAALIQGKIGHATYGVCHNTDDEGNMDYLCSVEVQSFAAVSSEFARLRIPRRRYAVFVHAEHVATIRATFNAIWNDWLPQNGHEVADAPVIERYDERFDPDTGRGGFEIWVPLRS